MKTLVCSEAGRHTQNWLDFRDLVCGVEEEGQEMRTGIGKRLVVLIPSPQLYVRYRMRRMNKVTGIFVLIID